MTTILTKKLQALTNLTEKRDSRWYVKGIHLNHEKGEAVVTDALLLLLVPIEKTAQECEFIPRSKLDEKLEIAKALKQETVSLTAEDVKNELRFPPYENAFPKSEMLTVSFDLGNLKKLITALETGAWNKKTTQVKFHFESAHRPVKVTCEDMTGLIVPTRE